MKVLLVDDSAVMRKIERQILEKLGITDVHEASDGEDAVKKLSELEFRVDLILLDWHMPGVDGITLLKKLRAIEHFKRTPIVMVTSEAESEMVAEAIKSGASNYVVKPFDEKTLGAKLKPFLK